MGVATVQLSSGLFRRRGHTVSILEMPGQDTSSHYDMAMHDTRARILALLRPAHKNDARLGHNFDHSIIYYDMYTGR